ncbi:MAG TPA: DsbA family protein [Microlunatus sp.]
MIIEVYADVLCGWAYIGKRRLERALELLDGRVQAAVVWRPYLIDPTAPSPSTDLADALAEPAIDAAMQRCSPGADAIVVRRSVADLAIEELAVERWGAQWRASSWAAHRLITSALDQGSQRQNDVIEMIMASHFVQGADINDLAFLRSVADRYGLPDPVAVPGGSSALAYLQPGVDRDDPVERATREASLFGQAIGVATSPTFVINDVIIETGAQPPELLADAIAFAADGSTSPIPDEVRRFRAARSLLEQRNPRGCLYLLEPLRPEYDGVRGFETLTARALAASASLAPAKAKLEELLQAHPDDAYLQLLLGKTLKRMQDPQADKHLALATAMNPEYLDF